MQTFHRTHLWPKQTCHPLCDLMCKSVCIEKRESYANGLLWPLLSVLKLSLSSFGLDDVSVCVVCKYRPGR